jgi:PKD repeat protein
LTAAALAMTVGTAWAQNQPPIADAGPDKNAYTGVPVTLNGSAFDPDGDPIVWWSWGVDQAPPSASYRLVNDDTANLGFIGYVQGDYLVSLTVFDGVYGGIDYATVHVADNLPPVAVATADPTTITVGGTVCFDGSQSYDPESRPLAYTWNFGDGSLSVFGQVSVCHQYLSVGTFNAFLLVVDERDAADVDYLTITVLPPANHPPVASPTATPNTGDAPLAVRFAANASDADSDPLTYAWDFGEGATSDQGDPLHTYTAAGTYTAWLTVSDAKDPVTASLTVVVNPAFVFKVTSASVRWNKKLLGDVTLSAHLDAPLPAPADLVSLTFDGIPLVSVPFSAFRPMADGSWRYNDAGLLAELDPAKQTLAVSTGSKTNLSTLDNSNGVAVELTLGDRTAVDTITLSGDKGNGLVYTAPAP